MINTWLQLLEETLHKYENAATTANTNPEDPKNGHCSYAHDVNGIGCAIGCHLPAQVALYVEQENPGETIDNILKYESNLGAQEIRRYINVDAIGIDKLKKLQSLHDGSKNVDRFRFQLEEEIRLIKAHQDKKELA